MCYNKRQNLFQKHHKVLIHATEPRGMEQNESQKTPYEYIRVTYEYFTARHLPQLIYPELHKASHSFAEEKSRTTNDKQLFGINGHKCDDFI